MIETKKTGMRLGVIQLDFFGALDTADLPDPFKATAPPGTPLGLGNPDFWPVPTAFAVAPGAIGMDIVEGTPVALAGISAAIGRLSRYCDLIIGNCGYMYTARTLPPSGTPTLLSGLQLLPNALASTSRPVGVLTFNQAGTEKLLASHPERSRLRIVGVDDQPAWSVVWHRDLITGNKFNPEKMRGELLDVCIRERRTGAFSDIGTLVLECTGMPIFRADIIAALKLPVWDIVAVTRGLLGV